jgi:hypothetical protein
MSQSGSVRVEVLSFRGCPHREPAIELVERVVSDLGLAVDVVCVDVPDAESASSTRFLGSPSIRVNGADVEPGARSRTDYVLGCRVYRTPDGLSGQPDEQWIRAALVRAHGSRASLRNAQKTHKRCMPR